MATYSTAIPVKSVYSAILSAFRKLKKFSAPIGNFLIKQRTTVAAASYDVINDKIQLLKFPDDTYLRGVSVVLDNEFDTGGTALRVGLVVDDGTTASTYTTAVGSAFANQPANDSVSVHSSSAADTTQTVTIIGTTVSTDTVVTEDIALDGTNVVDSVKTDWGVILGFKLDAVCAGTLTVEENSGNADIKTLAAGGTSSGVNTVTAGQTAFYDRLVRLVASEASTKQIGLKGTDSDGNVIYDSQALTGATSVLSNSRFSTVTEVYTGDLAATTTATITGTDKLLVTGSQAFSGVPTPLNYTGGTNPDTELYCDVSNDTLCLLIEAAPTTANTGNVTFTTKADVYIGDLADTGLSQ